jgi:hypothetical protein
MMNHILTIIPLIEVIVIPLIVFNNYDARIIGLIRTIITFFFTLNICTIILNSLGLEPGITIFIPEPNVDIVTSVGLLGFMIFVQFLIKKTLDSLIILKTSHYQNSDLSYTSRICDITDITGSKLREVIDFAFLIPGWWAPAHRNYFFYNTYHAINWDNNGHGQIRFLRWVHIYPIRILNTFFFDGLCNIYFIKNNITNKQFILVCNSTTIMCEEQLTSAYLWCQFND